MQLMREIRRDRERQRECMHLCVSVLNIGSSYLTSIHFKTSIPVKERETETEKGWETQ